MILDHLVDIPTRKGRLILQYTESMLSNITI